MARVTIWIDPPLWPAHGRVWSHLVSDHSYAELHDFAAAAGLPSRGFEGDHYDVPAEHYHHLVALGARATGGRDLVHRLQASGLRLRKRRGERGVARVRRVRFADDTLADVDLVAGRQPALPRRVFGAMVFVLDAAGSHLVVWSVRRVEWGPPGGWREGDEAVPAAAVREIAEETGLVLAAADLEPVGYERFTSIGDSGLRPPGRDLLQCYLVRLQVVAPRLTAESGDAPCDWVDTAELTARCGRLFWWPLARVVLGVD